jgi:hypothetical protein
VIGIYLLQLLQATVALLPLLLLQGHVLNAMLPAHPATHLRHCVLQEGGALRLQAGSDGRQHLTQRRACTPRQTAWRSSL